MKEQGAQKPELVDMYIKQIRSILEFAAPSWNGGITLAEKSDIERVQKSALHIILGDDYLYYQNALKISALNSLDVRRTNLCLKFARKAELDEKHSNWFKPKPILPTRQPKDKYCKPIARTDRLLNSPICYLTRLLNQNPRPSK